MRSRLLLPAYLRAVDHAEGWLGLDQAQTLHELARACSDGCIVEVGSYRGRSTVALAMGAMAGTKPAVYAIEPHEVFTGELGGQFGPEDRAAFYRTMLRTRAYRIVRLVNLPSTVAAAGWRHPIGLLWLDGDHSLEAVRADIEAWKPHLTRTAVIAFHDADDPNLGPYHVIRELIDSDAYQLLRGGPLSVLGPISSRLASQPTG